MNSGDRIPHIARCDGAGMVGFVLIAGFFSLLVTAGCGGGNTVNNVGSAGGGGGPVPASLSGTIKAGTAPNAIAVDSTTNKIYVTDFGTAPTTRSGGGCSPSSADVRAIDGATQQQTIASVGSVLPVKPYAAALNPTSHQLYMLSIEYWAGIKNNAFCGEFLQGLQIFDASTLQSGNVFAQVGVSDRSSVNIDMSPATGDIYVAGGTTVRILDSTRKLIAEVTVGSDPVGVAVNATTNKIYVANSGSNDVSVIDGASNSVVATITDPNAVAPVAIAVNPTTNTIYVANSQSNNLSVIDGASNSVTATIPIGTSPSSAAVDPQTNFIYIANAGNSQTGDPGSVTVMNGATNTTQTLTDPNAKNPVAVAVNPTTNKIYVANSGSNNVTVINGAHD